MDGFEINKILGAVLGTCLFTLALNIVSGNIFTVHKPEKPGYDIAVTETPAAGGAQAAAAPEEPIETRLASANPEKGATIAKKCLACHDLSKGGPNKVGPNLWGVIGRERGGHQGFAYSTPMKSKGGKWTLDDLDPYLKNPRAVVPGTSMAFIGLAKPNERADVIAYLNTLSDSPQPLPKAPPAGAAQQNGQGQQQQGGQAEQPKQSGQPKQQPAQNEQQPAQPTQQNQQAQPSPQNQPQGQQKQQPTQPKQQPAPQPKQPAQPKQ